MNQLITELQRLYFLDGQQWHSEHSGESAAPTGPAEGTLSPEIVAGSLAGETAVALNPVSPAGLARVMVINFKKAGDWELVADLFLAVQNDLDLPAPAVSVAGRDGYRLWLSLAEPVPVAQAERFLEMLRLKYLADTPVGHLDFCPASERPALIKLAPALEAATGKWSAFIDPSMVGMFAEGPWLEMAPNMGKQADMLAGLESIKSDDFQRALNALQLEAEKEATPGASTDAPPAGLPEEERSRIETEARRDGEILNVGSNFKDPASFLLAVMNDPTASPRLRIEAATALLPHFASLAGK